MSSPTKPGQAVRSIEGHIGITTTYVAKRSPTIGVMYLGFPYDVKSRVELLTVIEIVELIEAADA